MSRVGSAPGPQSFEVANGEVVVLDGPTPPELETIRRYLGLPAGTTVTAHEIEKACRTIHSDDPFAKSSADPTAFTVGVRVFLSNLRAGYEHADGQPLTYQPTTPVADLNRPTATTIPKINQPVLPAAPARVDAKTKQAIKDQQLVAFTGEYTGAINGKKSTEYTSAVKALQERVNAFMPEMQVTVNGDMEEPARGVIEIFVTWAKTVLSHESPGSVNVLSIGPQALGRLVKDDQARAGLPQTGVIDPATTLHMKAYADKTRLDDPESSAAGAVGKVLDIDQWEATERRQKQLAGLGLYSGAITGERDAATQQAEKIAMTMLDVVGTSPDALSRLDARLQEHFLSAQQGLKSLQAAGVGTFHLGTFGKEHDGLDGLHGDVTRDALVRLQKLPVFVAKAKELGIDGANLPSSGTYDLGTQQVLKELLANARK